MKSHLPIEKNIISLNDREQLFLCVYNYLEIKSYKTTDLKLFSQRITKIINNIRKIV